MMANDVPCVKPPASLSCLTKGVKISHTGLIWPISPTTNQVPQPTSERHSWELGNLTTILLILPILLILL